MANDKTVLVTGAGGFIGSHLCEQLLGEGYNVKALVSYRSNGSYGWLDRSEFTKEMEIIAADIRDPSAVRHAMGGVGAVLHLAALIGIPYSYVAPDSYVDVNIKGTLNVLQSARSLGTRVIHTSTSEVYGTAVSVPIDEDHPLQGQSPYSATKIGADQLALSFFRSFELPVTVVRPFNTFGPRQSERAVIPTIISQLLAGQTELRLGALTPTRDFNFVKDTASGFIAALKSKRAAGEVVNLASGHEISIQQTAELIGKILGIEVTFQSEVGRLRPKASEVERLLGANNKALQLLDWKPEYLGRAGLERGLAQTVDWYSSNRWALSRPQRYIV